jgi:hypothetical protein
VTKTILPLEAPNAPLFTLARRLRRFVRLVLEKPLTLPLCPASTRGRTPMFTHGLVEGERRKGPSYG